MKDVVWKSDNFAQQSVVSSVTQFLQRRPIRWAISVTAGAVDHRVNSTEGQTAPQGRIKSKLGLMLQPTNGLLFPALVNAFDIRCTYAE